MNIRQFMAAIAVAKKMDVDELGFEYHIEFDDVIAVMLMEKRSTVYLSRRDKHGTKIILTTIDVDADEVRKVADRIGYLDYF